MKIAIHGPDELFSEVWIDYCDRLGLDYRLVDCHASDIVQQVADCDIVMWQHRHFEVGGKLIGRQVLAALEQAGKVVFPDHRTGWHFDDKLAQKYLLEAAGAPFAPTVAFLDQRDAHAWASKAAFPCVFKLRGGSGSANVSLIDSESAAHAVISKAFSVGFSQYNPSRDLKETLYRCRQGKVKWSAVFGSLRRFLYSTPFARTYPRERSYVMFQKFFPGNQFDIRVLAIGDRACAVKRMVRPNDFRASGSGIWRHARHEFDEQCVRIALGVTHKLGMQGMGYDFVFDGDGKPYIIEMSYGFPGAIFRDCPGYWDSDLRWHEGKFRPEEWIVDTVIAQHRSRGLSAR